MLPETMFLIERMRRNRGVGRPESEEFQFANWPSTRLERAVFWSLCRIDACKRFWSLGHGGKGDGCA